MEHVDLIKRERSEVDQREVFIHLTEKVKASNLILKMLLLKWQPLHRLVQMKHKN